MRVSIDPTTGSVEIEGCDITPLVRRVTLDKHAGRQADVFLELAQGAEHEVLESDAIVHIVKTPEENPAAVILAWLNAVDPAALERAALEDMSMDSSTGQAFLDVLRGWVSGG